MYTLEAVAAACGTKGIAFLKGEATTNVRKISKEEAAPAAGGVGGGGSDSMTVTVGGQKFAVVFDGDKATVNGQSYDIQVAEGVGGESGGAAAPAAPGGGGTSVSAPMPGAVFAIKKNPGDAVEEGETILVLEAMKMEMAISSPATGVVGEIHVSKGEQVTAGQILATVC